MPTTRRFRGQQRRPQIDTAQAYESLWLDARYFQAGGKQLTREQFHAERFAEGELRALYEKNRSDFLALAPPGTRHCLWWEFDAPQARNPNETEAEQLDRLGLLTADKIEALRVAAVEDDRQLHAMPWHNGLPFSREWGYWRFVAREPRDPSVFESKQLMEMSALTSVEKQILAEPLRALGMKGAAICANRTRFYYLSPEEREMLGLARKHDPAIDAELGQ